MYARAQIILALAIVACSLCLVIAFPTADDELKISNKVRNPRLGGSRISQPLGKRDEDTTVNIDLSGSSNDDSSSAAAVASTASASAAPIASTSAAPIASTTNAPTPIPTAAPTATTHYASSFVFTASLKDTKPLNDGLVKMASLRKKGLKKSKKASKSAKSASKASKSAGSLTGTAAAAATATSN